MNVLFLIFNRPEETKRVFEEIRKAKPSKLFIAADGPRVSKPEDVKLCKETREILKGVDWQCEVKTLFRDVNLGCKKAVSSGISWFFEQVDEGVILEDDCLPDQSFFSFSDILLKKYISDNRVMHISGSNFQFGRRVNSDDYFFSHSAHIWGWATWKRAWSKYDLEMADLEETIKAGLIKKVFVDSKTARFWTKLLRHIKYKNVDTWDAAWAYALIKNQGLSINPSKNLVENIGFGENATHMDKQTMRMLQPAQSMDTLSMKHPDKIEADIEADIFEVKKLYLQPWYYKIFNLFKNFIISKK